MIEAVPDIVKEDPDLFITMFCIIGVFTMISIFVLLVISLIGYIIGAGFGHLVVVTGICS